MEAKMSDELKPCPFCGGKAELRIRDVNMPKEFQVRCNGFTCKVRPETDLFIEREDAIAAWNKRTPVKLYAYWTRCIANDCPESRDGKCGREQLADFPKDGKCLHPTFVEYDPAMENAYELEVKE
jgi:Lar family restriction alleviation protein